MGFKRVKKKSKKQIKEDDLLAKQHMAGKAEFENSYIFGLEEQKSADARRVAGFNT